MIIREIRKEELEKLLDLYTHLHDHDDPPPASEVINQTWKDILSAKNFICLGGFDESSLVSSCTICFVPNLTRGCRPYGIIENVVTNKRHRNIGYGRAVLSAALSLAWEKDCYKVMLMTGRLNEETFRFYESVGFNRHTKQAFIIKRPDESKSI